MDDDAKYVLHDLRNKLFQASSCLDVAKFDNPILNDDIWIEKTSQALVRANELIEEMVIPEQNSNNQKGSGTHQYVWQLQDYLEKHAIPDLKTLEKQHGLSVNIHLNLLEESKQVRLSDDKMRRIKENVIENAVSANANQLDVYYDMFATYYTVRFVDNGEGMDKETLDSLLLKQFDKDKLYGLGTKFIMTTAQEHNFVVTYHSVPGQGTTVRFLCRYYS